MSSTEEDKGSTQHVAFQMVEPIEIQIETGESNPPKVIAVVKNGVTPADESDEERDKLPFLKRQSRFSTVSSPGFLSMNSRPSFGGMSSRPSFGGMSSRPSFGGMSFGNLSSRPSMVSLRSTISRVNSELYPERGSFVAFGLGQSLADFPPLAQKMYIITQVLAAVSVAMGSMAVGFSAAYTSPALASLSSANSTINVTEEEKSWIGSLMPLSALTGSIIGGYLIDALGRKMVILLCGPPFILAWLLIGSSVNIMMIYAGRVVGGVCVGLLTLTLPVYLGETIQPEIRGILGLLPTTFGNAGILVCFVVGTYANWWVLAYAGAIIPFIFTAMMCFVPETPRWYISKDRVDDARCSLLWLRGSESEAEYELEAIHDNFEFSRQESSSLKDIFNRRQIRPFLLSLGLMMFQQLSGINAVIFYTVSIFEMSGSSISGHLSTIIVGIVNLLATFIANALIDKLGRKILLYISSALMVLSLVSLGVYFYLKSTVDDEMMDEAQEQWETTIKSLSWLPLVSFMVYVIAFSLGWGPIPWLFMGEALPAKIRGPAASVITAFNWSCTFLITKTFPVMVEAMGPSNVFFMFSGIMIFGSLYVIFFVIETKGKTLEEIEEELSGRKARANRKISTVSGLHMK
ncbi:hypothetical protein OTU49_004551 [Cherax quadricarinatus]|uniref:Major facilitator superfamily (MFS) profile domain-containing protein n=1 Tax=Cherax quadricarinatus TaxID=27406 RepID=A0AAW0X120_CHEQU